MLAEGGHRCMGLLPTQGVGKAQLSAELAHYSADLLIAATPLIHGLTVVTCNLRPFTPTHVATFNPWGDG